MFVKVGERVRYIAQNRYRYGSWPEGAWLEHGVTGTVTKYYPEHPALTIRGEYFEGIGPWALITWDNGGQTAISPEDEGQVWEKIEETVMPVKGERELSIADYDKLYTLNELRKMCRERGIYPSGDKKALVSKLLSQEVWDVDEIKSKIQALPPEQRREILTKHPHLALE